MRIIMVIDECYVPWDSLLGVQIDRDQDRGTEWGKGKAQELSLVQAYQADHNNISEQLHIAFRIVLDLAEAENIT
jgi:hypothetical protein